MVHLLQRLVHLFVSIDDPIHFFEKALQLYNLLIFLFYLSELGQFNLFAEVKLLVQIINRDRGLVE